MFKQKCPECSAMMDPVGEKRWLCPECGLVLTPEDWYAAASDDDGEDISWIAELWEASGKDAGGMLGYTAKELEAAL